MNLEELKVIDVSDITSGHSVNVPSKTPDILEDGKIIDVSNIITVRHDPEIWPNKGAMTLRNLCPNSPENKDLLNKLQAIVDANHLVCDESLFEGEFEVISNIKEVKKLLTEVIIRFDTDPDYYSKDDYQVLVALLYRSLLYLYVRGDGVFHVNDKTTAEAISENKADTIYFTTDNKTIVYKGQEYGTVDPEGILACFAQQLRSIIGY